MTDELIERLRKEGAWTHHKPYWHLTNPDGPEAADRIEALEAAHDSRATKMKALTEALRYYRDQLCEGFCEGFTPSICQAAMAENPTGGDCSGCRAVIALSGIATKGEGSDE